MVKLRVAEALEGKQILFVPGGGKGGALQTMNVNDLISRYATMQIQEAGTAAKKVAEGEAK